MVHAHSPTAKWTCGESNSERCAYKCASFRPAGPHCYRMLSVPIGIRIGIRIRIRMRDFFSYLKSNQFHVKPNASRAQRFVSCTAFG